MGKKQDQREIAGASDDIQEEASGTAAESTPNNTDGAKMDSTKKNKGTTSEGKESGKKPASGAYTQYKDRLFKWLFGREERKEWALSLYNAINGTNHTNSDILVFNTIEDVIYMGMKNDVSFIIIPYINLYEEQSTYNPNMPVRFYMYYARVLERFIKEHDLYIYGSTLQGLPPPRCVCFYVGTDWPDPDQDKIDLHLKDAFAKFAKDNNIANYDPSDLDTGLTVHMYNINQGHCTDVLSKCKPLDEFSWLVEKVYDNNQSSDSLKEAIDKAIDQMPDDFLIKGLLTAHRAEVNYMLLTEYNEADVRRMERREGYNLGISAAANLLCEMVDDDSISAETAATRLRWSLSRFQTYYKDWKAGKH